jgi:hypothetical protein
MILQTKAESGSKRFPRRPLGRQAFSRFNIQDVVPLLFFDGPVAIRYSSHPTNAMITSPGQPPKGGASNSVKGSGLRPGHKALRAIGKANRMPNSASPVIKPAE